MILNLEIIQGGDSPVSLTLAAEQADVDLGLVQPAAVLRCVVGSEPVPYTATNLLAERVRECFTAVRTQVIQACLRHCPRREAESGRRVPRRFILD